MSQFNEKIKTCHVFASVYLFIFLNVCVFTDESLTGIDSTPTIYHRVDYWQVFKDKKMLIILVRLSLTRCLLKLINPLPRLDIDLDFHLVLSISGTPSVVRTQVQKSVFISFMNNVQQTLANSKIYRIPQTFIGFLSD